MTTTGTPTTIDEGTLAAARTAWEDWRRERTTTLSAPHGWLSLTGLHWLDAEPAAVEGLPGRWTSVDGGVDVTATAADGIVLDGSPVEGTVRVGTTEGAPGTLVEVGERRVEVLQRSGNHALRVRDPQSPTLAAFAGVPVFRFSPRYVLPAEFVPHEQVQDVVVGAVVEGLEHRYRGVGLVRFDLDGPQQLTVFQGGTTLFTDATSGVTTTGTTRSVTVPTTPGPVVLDLNRAQNLPCAFTDFATCPLPPVENRLTVPVAAGEKDPR
ncbi:DUF1684 domain-containing protein [Kineococcus sp. LSe6-4]|uniref:DUF1684 domain-containing protein n=1 Tax=Kineococcus halophytocola TaxID=3234027 RepID=A0ABV4H1K0_9ACTN